MKQNELLELMDSTLKKFCGEEVHIISKEYSGEATLWKEENIEMYGFKRDKHPSVMFTLIDILTIWIYTDRNPVIMLKGFANEKTNNNNH